MDKAVVSYQYDTKDGKKIWVSARNVPFWYGGNCAYLSDEEIKEHLGQDFLEKHQEKYRHAVKDRDYFYIFPGDYVREYVKYPEYSEINKEGKKENDYWTRKGWSNLSIYDQYIIYQVEKIRLGLVSLQSICLKTEIWQGKEIVTEVSEINTNTSQAMNRGVFERGWQRIGVCDENLVEGYLAKEKKEVAEPNGYREFAKAITNVVKESEIKDVPLASVPETSDLDSLIDKFESSSKIEEKSKFPIIKLKHIPYKQCPICDAKPKELQVHFANPGISSFYTKEMNADQSENVYFDCGCAYNHSYALPSSGAALIAKCPNAHERLLAKKHSTLKLGGLEYQFERLSMMECPVCESKIIFLKVNYNIMCQGMFYTEESIGFACGCKYKYEKGTVDHISACVKCPNAHDRYLALKKRIAGYGYGC